MEQINKTHSVTKLRSRSAACFLVKYGLKNAFRPINCDLYAYAANNPLRYIDPTGMWTDNHDGTYTAVAGDTLWGRYGSEWKEKSGYTGDPSKLQVGDVVGLVDNYDFTNAQTVELDLHFRAGISVDFGINKYFINYSNYRIKIK